MVSVQVPASGNICAVVGPCLNKKRAKNFFTPFFFFVLSSTTVTAARVTEGLRDGKCAL